MRLATYKTISIMQFVLYSIVTDTISDDLIVWRHKFKRKTEQVASRRKYSASTRLTQSKRVRRLRSLQTLPLPIGVRILNY